ncbi:MAG: hypothetical protein GY944_31025, partial [bacterium]|nr:hypothetical protein [bacterium]
MHRARLMLLLLLVVYFDSWPTDARAQEQDGDDKPPAVEQIRWFGNDALPAGKLADHILTQSPPWYRFWETRRLHEDEIREDMQRISALYRQYGYYEANAQYTIIGGEDATRVTIHVRIDEGEPVRIRSLRIHMPDGGDPTAHPLIKKKAWKKLLSRLDLQRDQIFELAPYRDARAQILAWLAELGYPRAQLEGGAEVDLKRHWADVAWSLSLGPRVRLGDVEIAGLEKVEERIVRREIRLDPGQWYSARAIAKTRRRIQNLGLFRYTVVEAQAPEGDPDYEDEASLLDPPEEVTWPVSIRLAERPARRVRIGGGWGTDTSFRGELSWHHRNFFGGARHMDVGLLGSGLGATFRPSFMEPY